MQFIFVQYIYQLKNKIKQQRSVGKRVYWRYDDMSLPMLKGRKGRKYTWFALQLINACYVSADIID